MGAAIDFEIRPQTSPLGKWFNESNNGAILRSAELGKEQQQQAGNQRTTAAAVVGAASTAAPLPGHQAAPLGQVRSRDT